MRNMKELELIHVRQRIEREKSLIKEMSQVKKNYRIRIRAFPQTFVCRNDIYTAQGEKIIIFPKSSGNMISSHKSLWKCYSHNKGFLMQKYPFILVRDF